jgi:hypothetical protein
MDCFNSALIFFFFCTSEFIYSARFLIFFIWSINSIIQKKKFNQILNFLLTKHKTLALVKINRVTGRKKTIIDKATLNKIVTGVNEIILLEQEIMEI